MSFTMNISSITCNYDLPDFFRRVIGMTLTSVSFAKGTLLRSDTLSFQGTGDMVLTFYDAREDKHHSARLSPKGKESMAGNLYGFELQDLGAERRFDLMGFGFGALIHEHNTGKDVVRVYAIGEDRKYDIVDLTRDDLLFWFGEADILPKSIPVDIRTLEFIVFEFATAEFFYLSSEGEGYYRAFFEPTVAPRQFICGEDFRAMDKAPQVLEIFE